MDYKHDIGYYGDLDKILHVRAIKGEVDNYLKNKSQKGQKHLYEKSSEEDDSQVIFLWVASRSFQGPTLD